MILNFKSTNSVYSHLFSENSIFIYIEFCSEVCEILT